ncbi:hypothetical protein EYC80_010010 [Monilinia laxa]|uniref:Uncharacterized protein n=1 Tax=Monilinia laxa TaxID=61186 RepID=A0A5N6JU80_MONLA|nr:hypothetical protein EYC80_010010 [Monilinia laxa]
MSNSDSRKRRGKVGAMQAMYKRTSPVCEGSESAFGLNSIDQLKTEEATDPQFEMPFNYGLNLATVVNNSNRTSTKQQRATQKAVSKWFDSHPSANSPDIYQPEWRERIASWQKCTSCSPASNTSHGQWLMELDFSKFFVEHPVAAISLWNLLQAFYGLDEAVCQDSKAVVKWREMKPFAYLTARKVENKWRDSLRELKRRILDHRISSDEIIHRLYEIRCSVDKVEEVLAELKENFLDNLKDESFTPKMLDDIERAVNWRFNAIDNSLEFSEEDLEVTKENGKENLEETYKHERELNIRYGNMNSIPDFQPRMLSRSSRRNSMRDYVMILIEAPQGLPILYVALITLLVAFFMRPAR